MFVVPILDPSRPLPGLHARLSAADHARPAGLIFVLARRISLSDLLEFLKVLVYRVLLTLRPHRRRRPSSS